MSEGSLLERGMKLHEETFGQTGSQPAVEVKKGGVLQEVRDIEKRKKNIDPNQIREDRIQSSIDRGGQVSSHKLGVSHENEAPIEVQRDEAYQDVSTKIAKFLGDVQNGIEKTSNFEQRVDDWISDYGYDDISGLVQMAIGSERMKLTIQDEAKEIARIWQNPNAPNYAVDQDNNPAFLPYFMTAAKKTGHKEEYFIRDNDIVRHEHDFHGEITDEMLKRVTTRQVDGLGAKIADHKHTKHYIEIKEMRKMMEEFVVSEPEFSHAKSWLPGNNLFWVGYGKNYIDGVYLDDDERQEQAERSEGILGDMRDDIKINLTKHLSFTVHFKDLLNLAENINKQGAKIFKIDSWDDTRFAEVVNPDKIKAGTKMLCIIGVDPDGFPILEPGEARSAELIVI